MGDGWGGASTVALQPIQASRRHPADYRDELEPPRPPLAPAPTAATVTRTRTSALALTERIRQ